MLSRDQQSVRNTALRYFVGSSNVNSRTETNQGLLETIGWSTWSNIVDLVGLAKVKYQFENSIKTPIDKTISVWYKTSGRKKKIEHHKLPQQRGLRGCTSNGSTFNWDTQTGRDYDYNWYCQQRFTYLPYSPTQHMYIFPTNKYDSEIIYERNDTNINNFYKAIIFL